MHHELGVLAAAVLKPGLFATRGRRPVDEDMPVDEQENGGLCCQVQASRMMTKEKAAHTKETQVKLVNPFPRPF